MTRTALTLAYDRALAASVTAFTTAMQLPNRANALKLRKAQRELNRLRSKLKAQEPR